MLASVSAPYGWFVPEWAEKFTSFGRTDYVTRDQHSGASVWAATGDAMGGRRVSSNTLGMILNAVGSAITSATRAAVDGLCQGRVWRGRRQARDELRKCD
jgi:hypothetical protein